MMAAKYRTWLAVAGGVLLLASIAALLVLLNRPARRSPVMLALGRAVVVRNALGAYAQEHGGKFPRALNELPPEFFPRDAMQFHDPVTGQTGDWIYCAGYTLPAGHYDPRQARNIVLASPFMVAGHQRVVVYADTTADVLEEDDFSMQISNQLNERPINFPTPTDAPSH